MKAYYQIRYGGSWRFWMGSAQAADSGMYESKYRINDIGLRLARTPLQRAVR